MSPTKRFDPFAFSSDTGFRFFLLIASVLAASAMIYISIFSVGLPWSHQQTNSASLAACNLEKDPFACMAPRLPQVRPWMLGSLAVLFGIACAIYWTYPSWKIRRDRLIPLTVNDARDVVEYIQDLSRRAGLAQAPNLVWNPFNTAKTGLAFGRIGRRYIALSGGLTVEFYRDQAAFRAVVLHELAHLRNADVDKTYLTLAIWRAFVLAALIPFALASIRDPTDGWALSWRIVALAILVYLIRSAVLRAREFYADVRASMWDGPASGLGRVLESMPETKTSGWRAVFGLHPRPVDRLRVLNDSSLLLRPQIWDTFAAAVIAAGGAPTALGIFSVFLGNAENVPFVENVVFIAPLLTIAVVVWGVGIQVWRATFAAGARGEIPQGIGRLGFGLALGLFVGQFLSMVPLAGPIWSVGTLWSLVLFASIGCFVPWLGMVGASWSEATGRWRSFRAIYRLSLAAGGLVVCVWAGFVYFFLQALRFRSISEASGDFFTILLTFPLLTAAFAGMWAIPLAASPLKRLWSEPFRLNTALKAGTIGGLSFCAVMILARLVLRAELPPEIGRSEAFRSGFSMGQIGLAAMFQAGIAFRVQRRVRHLPVVHGLFAAFVGAVLMVAVGVVGGRVMLPVPALPGQKLGQISIGFGFVLYNFVGVVNSGTLLSVIAMNARSFIADAGEYLRSGVRYVRNLRPATAV